jgi:hypothetical protein
MHDQLNSPLVSVVIIGRTHANEFRAMVRQIQDSSHLLVVGQFETIEEALTAGLGERLSAEVVVVLQAFSDEYNSAQVSQLIGRMLFGRVLCCYGPWCVSDGRTHDVWPVATRVSVASAFAVLGQEVRNIRTGVAALLPMAAPEEIFLHRSTIESQSHPAASNSILIASDDRTLRETISETLRHTFESVFECSLSPIPFRHALENLSAASVRHSTAFVLLDIDGVECRESELIESIQTELPACRRLRLSSFPQSIPDNGEYEQIIDKLEFTVQLSQCRS